ncbi:HCRTR2 (predicted) [Pycnogonum litorale]
MSDTNVTNHTYSLNVSQKCPYYKCLEYDDYVDFIQDYIYPKWYEWIFIWMHLLVFIVGIVGNLLVCISVYRNRSMRTVTNYFIVNLAVADFLVILICLPPTVLWDVTETWFFGSSLCKLIVYFQNSSVYVSILTFSAISVDRWKAICNPLKKKSTSRWVKVTIGVTWTLSLGAGIPHIIWYETKPTLNMNKYLYLTDCKPTWGETATETEMWLTLIIVYVLPLTTMAFLYHRIAIVLWSKDIPGTSECGNEASYRRHPNIEGQIKSRRKAAKMLMAVVFIFGLCYLPLHLLNIIRYTVKPSQTDAITIVSLLSHWLCYFNSSVNPVIYTFMSDKFRKEFQKALKCECIFVYYTIRRNRQLAVVDGLQTELVRMSSRTTRNRI